MDEPEYSALWLDSPFLLGPHCAYITEKEELLKHPGERGGSYQVSNSHIPIGAVQSRRPVVTGHCARASYRNTAECETTTHCSEHSE